MSRSSANGEEQAANIQTNNGSAFSCAMSTLQICSSCVMDTSDSLITFDENGVCDHCTGFKQYVMPHWHPDETGRQDVRARRRRNPAEREGQGVRLHHRDERRADSSYICT